jgi:hypothetical protein
MQIGGDESRGYTRDGDGGQPVPAPGELGGKQPNVFLIAEKVSRERAPGDVAITSSSPCVLSRSVLVGFLLRFLRLQRETS